jgi:hypothetical protein
MNAWACQHGRKVLRGDPFLSHQIDMVKEERPVPGPAWTPSLPVPGPEHAALARFHYNGTWEGTVQPDGMGPGSPEMQAKGSATCAWIINGLWLDCVFSQDQFVAGKKVLSWMARWIAGWDRAAGEYRAVGVDNNGSAFIFRGKIAGDRLIMESIGDSAVRLRFTWDAADPAAVTWKNEVSVGGTPWRLIEEYVILPDHP